MGLLAIRLSASMFEIYKLYAFMGLNRYAFKEESLLQYSYNGNPNCSFTLEFVNTTNERAIKITNTGSVDFLCSISKLNML